jgi:hypothetical protein
MTKSEIACLKEEIVRLQTELNNYSNNASETLSARSSRTIDSLSSSHAAVNPESKKELKDAKLTTQWSFWDYIFSPATPAVDNSKVFRV